MILMFTKPDDGAKVSYLYQWDTKVVAEFVLPSNSSNVECVFSTNKMDEGIRKTATKSGDIWMVQVPDKVLTYGTNVHAFIAFVGADSRRTVQDCYISVKKAAKPEGYISADTSEYVSTKELFEIAKTLKSETETARDQAVSAKNNAETAKGLAESAVEKAESAKIELEIARDQAVSAKNDAETAKNAAVKAKEEAETAKSSTETIKNKAEAALNKATIDIEQAQKNALENIRKEESDSEQKIISKTNEQLERIPEVVKFDEEIKEFKKLGLTVKNGMLCQTYNT